MAKLSIDDVRLKGKRVLLRVDFNVPLNEDLTIADDRRIRAALPTIERVISQGGMPILMSHLGRPKGRVRPELSLKPVASRLQELLGRDVLMAPDCVGSEVEDMVSGMKSGQVVLLENVRFHSQETENDPEFSRRLAALGDLYINDAFGTAHRAHASTEGAARHFRQAAAGYLMDKELEYLSRALTDPVRPFLAILGGAKISGKIDIIQSLMGRVDVLLIGGGMAFTFLKARGLEVGGSLVEDDRIELAKGILDEAAQRRLDFQLPMDVVVATKIQPGAKAKVVARENIPSDMIGVDIGPVTLNLFSQKISGAKTVVWNGPMGVFEIESFAKGTYGIAKALAEVTDAGGLTIVGGGDSAAALARGGYEDHISHISTGGGASLEFLAGRSLPGVEVLTEKD